MRQLLLGLSQQQSFRRFLIGSPATTDLVHRYLAGEHFEDLIAVFRDQQPKGLSLSADLLCPNAHDDQQATTNTTKYLNLIRGLDARGFAENTEISVKLAAIGAGLGDDGPGLAQHNVQEICAAADNSGAYITLFMGHSATTDTTLQIAADLRKRYPDLGVTVLANLRRTQSDLRDLTHDCARIRLCKGAHKEQPDAVYTDGHEIDLNYVRCLRFLMDSPAYPMIATHDPRLVEIALELARRGDRPASSYEFQMFYGVRPLEQRRLVDIGRTMRTYTPFGPDWYSYILKRAAERPYNAALYARSLIGRR